MPAGYIAVTKSMEYIGHFKCMLRCPPASALGWLATSVLYTKEGTGRTSQQPRCFLGCLRGVLSPLQQLLPVSWQAGPGQPGGRRAPCTVVATRLRDHTCVKAGWMVLKEGNNFISCHIICFLDLSYSVFFCCVISTKKKKKSRWEEACWNKHTKMACFHLIWKIYHMVQVAIRQHYSNKVWPAFLQCMKHFLWDLCPPSIYSPYVVYITNSCEKDSGNFLRLMLGSFFFPQ